MKKSIHLFSLLLPLLFFGFDEPYYYSEYRPVFMLRAEMEKNVRLDAPRPVRNPGKIYLKDNLIFINEKYRGVHVIDNSDPAFPVNFAFITIDGCIDVAIKNDVLYADNAVDLIAVRLQNFPRNIVVTERIKNVFPEPVSPDGRSLSWKEQQAKPKNAILVRWDKNQ